MRAWHRSLCQQPVHNRTILSRQRAVTEQLGAVETIRNPDRLMHSGIATNSAPAAIPAKGGKSAMSTIVLEAGDGKFYIR